MPTIIQKTKLLIVRLLSRVFHKISDPQIQAQIIDRRDYEFYQSERRRNIEKYLSKYLGPKL